MGIRVDKYGFTGNRNFVVPQGEYATGDYDVIWSTTELSMSSLRYADLQSTSNLIFRPVEMTEEDGLVPATMIDLGALNGGISTLTGIYNSSPGNET